MVKKIIFFLLCLFISYGVFSDEKGDVIAKKHYALKKANDTYAIATMVLIDKSGNKKIRKVEMYSKESNDGTNSFIKFLEPADIMGTKFLSIPHKGTSDEQRIYLPALKRARKISSSDKSNEFVGSDLYYYDMENRTFEDNTYKFLSENETINDKAFEGMKFYKIEITSKETDSPYSKSIAYINMVNYCMYKTECYDKKDGALLKTITFLKIDNTNGVLTPVQTVVINNKKGSKTLLQMNDLKINIGIKDSIFSVQNLEQ